MRDQRTIYCLFSTERVAVIARCGTGDNKRGKEKGGRGRGTEGRREGVNSEDGEKKERERVDHV